MNKFLKYFSIIVMCISSVCLTQTLLYSYNNLRVPLKSAYERLHSAELERLFQIIGDYVHSEDLIERLNKKSLQSVIAAFWGEKLSAIELSEIEVAKLTEYPRLLNIVKLVELMVESRDTKAYDFLVYLDDELRKINLSVGLESKSDIFPLDIRTKQWEEKFTIEENFDFREPEIPDIVLISSLRSLNLYPKRCNKDDINLLIQYTRHPYRRIALCALNTLNSIPSITKQQFVDIYLNFLKVQFSYDKLRIKAALSNQEFLYETAHNIFGEEWHMRAITCVTAELVDIGTEKLIYNVQLDFGDKASRTIGMAINFSNPRCANIWDVDILRGGSIDLLKDSYGWSKKLSDKGIACKIGGFWSFSNSLTIQDYDYEEHCEYQTGLSYDVCVYSRQFIENGKSIHNILADKTLEEASQEELVIKGIFVYLDVFFFFREGLNGPVIMDPHEYNILFNGKEWLVVDSDRIIPESSLFFCISNLMHSTRGIGDEDMLIKTLARYAKEKLSYVLNYNGREKLDYFLGQNKIRSTI